MPLQSPWFESPIGEAMDQLSKTCPPGTACGAATNPRGDVLTTEQVARLLQVRPCTVADWARRGIIPSYKLGKFRRYSREDVLAWVADRRHDCTGVPR